MERRYWVIYEYDKKATAARSPGRLPAPVFRK
jgi:hypothetical protein